MWFRIFRRMSTASECARQAHRERPEARTGPSRPPPPCAHFWPTGPQAASSQGEWCHTLQTSHHLDDDMGPGVHCVTGGRPTPAEASPQILCWGNRAQRTRTRTHTRSLRLAASDVTGGPPAAALVGEDKTSKLRGLNRIGQAEGAERTRESVSACRWWCSASQCGLAYV